VISARVQAVGSRPARVVVFPRALAVAHRQAQVASSRPGPVAECRPAQVVGSRLVRVGDSRPDPEVASRPAREVACRPGPVADFHPGPEVASPRERATTTIGVTGHRCRRSVSARGAWSVPDRRDDGARRRPLGSEICLGCANPSSTHRGWVLRLGDASIGMDGANLDSVGTWPPRARELTLTGLVCESSGKVSSLGGRALGNPALARLNWKMTQWSPTLVATTGPRQ
jgi:hypothetical protein